MNAAKETKSPKTIDEEQSFGAQHKTTRSASDIATRAYELWQERGFSDGSAEEDWCQAEHEVASSQAPS